MSTGNPHLDGNVHRKRQRTASQDSIERRSAKKARSGPHHQFSRTTINLNATSIPRQSTTRRAATDVCHNTKQDLLDLRASQECLSLPHSPLPSANSPQRLPLTEESLRLLNNRCPSSGSKKSEYSTSYASLETSPSDKAIDAYDPDYSRTLMFQQVRFTNDFRDGRAPELEKLRTVLLAPRESPEPDEASTKLCQRAIDRAPTEREATGTVLRDIIPLDALGNDAFSVSDVEWKSGLETGWKPSPLAPKPDTTIGWRAEVFNEDFPKACELLDTFTFPTIGERDLAWPLFTIESGGENGSRRVARLHNLHNGSVMLSNLYALKQMYKREETFFDKVHAMGVEIFDGSIQLSCYWATRSEKGHVRYLGDSIETWSLLESSGRSYREARRCIHNAIDWVRSEAQEWIRSDLRAIEDKLISVPLSQLTQPKYHSARSSVPSRRVSKASTSANNCEY